MPWLEPPPSIPQQQVDAELQQERAQIDQALAKKRLSFSTAQLDLYNLGEAQKAYRLDLGVCQSNNDHFAKPALWGEAIQVASVKIQFAPEVTNVLFKQYFTGADTIYGDVFIYGGKTYSYLMGGYSNQLEELPPAENELIINRNERWINPSEKKTYLVMHNICSFNYQPTQGVPK